MISKINSFINTPKYYIPTVLLAGSIATALLYFGSSEATKIVGGSFAGLGGVIVLIKFKHWHAQHASKMITLNPQRTNHIEDHDELSEIPENEGLMYNNTVWEMRCQFSEFNTGFIDSQGNETFLSALPRNTTLTNHATADNHFFIEFTSNWTHSKRDKATISNCSIGKGKWEIYSPNGELVTPEGNTRIMDLLKNNYRVRIMHKIPVN